MDISNLLSVYLNWSYVSISASRCFPNFNIGVLSSTSTYTFYVWHVFSTYVYIGELQNISLCLQLYKRMAVKIYFIATTSVYLHSISVPLPVNIINYRNFILCYYFCSSTICIFYICTFLHSLCISSFQFAFILIVCNFRKYFTLSINVAVSLLLNHVETLSLQCILQRILIKVFFIILVVW